MPVRPGLVAVVRVEDVIEAAAFDFLAEREHARLRALRRRERRLEWIAARLAAKYLFLGAFEQPGTAAPESWHPTIERLTWSALDHLPRWAYRAVEILAPNGTGSGVPRLRWHGGVQPVHVSLAHRAGLAGACLDWQASVGIDIERIEPRSAAFRATNFSAAERRWADAASRRSAAGDHAYSLLWSLKESALKAQERDDASLWRLGGVELSVADGADAWDEALHGCGRLRPLVMPANVGSSPNRRAAEVFAAAEDELLITGVRLQGRVA